MFQDLTAKHSYDTGTESIVSLIINYPPTRIIALMQASNQLWKLSQYDLNSNKLITEHAIEGTYILSQTIKQDTTGTRFGLTYLDDGEFHFMMCDLEDKLFDFNINKHFGIDNETMPIKGFYNPFVLFCFIDNCTKAFITFFQRKNLTQYHFMFDIKAQKPCSELI